MDLNDVYVLKYGDDRKLKLLKDLRDLKNVKRCKYCGGNYEFKREKCLVYGKICGKCGKSNYFVRVCKQCG